MLSLVYGEEPKLNFCDLLEATFCKHETKHHMVSEIRTWTLHQSSVYLSEVQIILLNMLGASVNCNIVAVELQLSGGGLVVLFLFFGGFFGLPVVEIFSLKLVYSSVLGGVASQGQGLFLQLHPRGLLQSWLALKSVFFIYSLIIPIYLTPRALSQCYSCFRPC